MYFFVPLPRVSEDGTILRRLNILYRSSRYYAVEDNGGQTPRVQIIRFDFKPEYNMFAGFFFLNDS